MREEGGSWQRTAQSTANHFSTPWWPFPNSSKALTFNAQVSPLRCLLKNKVKTKATKHYIQLHRAHSKPWINATDTQLQKPATESLPDATSKCFPSKCSWRPNQVLIPAQRTQPSARPSLNPDLETTSNSFPAISGTTLMRISYQAEETSTMHAPTTSSNPSGNPEIESYTTRSKENW